MAIEASVRIAFLKRHYLRELGRTLIERHELKRISLGMEDINNVKADLQEFATERYKGASIRSRFRRFLDEQPSSRALSDERHSALAKEILEIQYGGQNWGSDYSCLLVAFPRLDDEQRVLVEAPITLDEIKSAISEQQG